MLDPGLLAEHERNGGDTEALEADVASGNLPKAPGAPDASGRVTNDSDFVSRGTIALAEEAGFPSAETFRGKILADPAFAQAVHDWCPSVARKLGYQGNQLQRMLRLYVKAAQFVGRTDVEISQHSGRTRVTISMDRSLARRTRLLAVERQESASATCIAALELALPELEKQFAKAANTKKEGLHAQAR